MLKILPVHSNFLFEEIITGELRLTFGSTTQLPMKPAFTFILIFACLFLRAQTEKPEFDAAKYQPPYQLAQPEGWGVERFPIPIDFAPQIPYKGVEDIRFAPGWGDATKEDYWSYCFLWYLQGDLKFTPAKVEQHLKDYYSGLIGRNISRRNIPKEKLVPTITTLAITQSVKGDLATYMGTVSMLDYMQQKPMVLNCIVHIKSCMDPNKTFVFYQLSPKPFTEKVWTDMNDLWANFICGSN